jgi:hypothetical protein
MPPRIAGLLIGGDAGAIRYAQRDWDRLQHFLSASSNQHGTRWIVSTSRRTPGHVGDDLMRRAADREGAILDFMDARNPATGGLIDVFARAEAIVCTDDSSTMVSEAVWARLPVLGVRPERHRFTSDEDGYRRYLTENGWYRSVPIADLTPERLLYELSAIRPMQDNPLDRLASLIRGRIPALLNENGAPAS